MALTFRDRFKHNLFIWFFGLTKVRLILFCRPKIVDINDDEVIGTILDPDDIKAL